MKYKQLRYDLAVMGSECIMETLSNYPTLKKNAKKQEPISDKIKFTKAPKIHKSILSVEVETPQRFLFFIFFFFHFFFVFRSLFL
jgi:hypothetical protein